jgi:L-threonylcarbamoyladenylate synthase
LVEFSAIAERLADQFWPGALSLILPRRADCPVSLLAGAGLDTLALRVPDHDIAQALLVASGCPIAAPSANRSGEVSPTRAEHVAGSLGRSVDLVLDGGPCRLGVESTVLDLTRDIPTILRPGGVPREALEDAIGPIDVLAETSAAPASPGMLASHYAPGLKLRAGIAKILDGEALLSFGPHDLTGFSEERNLSPRGDLAEAAANLFAMMRALDRPKFTGIAAMRVPDEGLGRAINDRLERAAAPR